MADKPAPHGARIAENAARWPEIATMLAPAAACDCQMLAITISEQVTAAAMTDRPGTSTKN